MFQTITKGLRRAAFGVAALAVTATVAPAQEIRIGAMREEPRGMSSPRPSSR